MREIESCLEPKSSSVFNDVSNLVRDKVQDKVFINFARGYNLLFRPYLTGIQP